MRTSNKRKKTRNPPALPLPNLKELLCQQPLSILFDDLPREERCGSVRDLTGWVHRSPNARIDEAQEKGKESRPMNAFMLYRSAYHKPVKDYLRRKKHPAHGQAISRIIGLGWWSETIAVRRKFEDLASIERHNHLTLHPKASQSISKTRRQSKKRAPSLHIDSRAGVYSSMVHSEGSQDSESELSSPSSEESESWMNTPNNSTWRATCDCRATSEKHPSPWLLGEIRGEIGNLRALGFENSSSDEAKLESNSQSQCTRYIDPRLLICGEASLRA